MSDPTVGPRMMTNAQRQAWFAAKLTNTEDVFVHRPGAALPVDEPDDIILGPLGDYIAQTTPPRVPVVTEEQKAAQRYTREAQAEVDALCPVLADADLVQVESQVNERNRTLDWLAGRAVGICKSLLLVGAGACGFGVAMGLLFNRRWVGIAAAAVMLLLCVKDFKWEVTMWLDRWRQLR